MRAVFVLLFFLLQALVLLTGGRQRELATALDTETRDYTLYQLAAAVNNYFVEKNTYPASIAALVASPGYEYLRESVRPFQTFAVASNLSDGSFQYKRAVIYSQDPYNPQMTDNTYLSAANNTCGTGDFASATDWCGPNNATTRWWKHESREEIATALANERRRLFRLLQKFNGWYNDDITVSTQPNVLGNNYPNPGAPAATLITLVSGFTQTAVTCTGMYSWSRIPIGCSDLFSIWGTPTVYNYISPTHIVLMTQTPYTKADGTTLYVSTEESL